MTQVSTPISYDHGVSGKKLIGETIGAFFDRAVETWRDREALVVRQQDVRWSWGELGRRVDDLAAGLLSLGLQPGDRVGMWAPNRSEWTLTQFATAKAGLVLVNVNPAYRRSELEYAMNKVECKALVLAPALWRPRRSNIGDWRWPTIFIAVIVAAYLPYIGVGSRVLGFLQGYVAEENLVSGTGFWVLDMIRRAVPVPLAAYLGLSITVMAGLAIGALRRSANPRSSLPWATALGTAALFFTSPHYPWYFVWLVALLTAAPWWPAWWLTLAAVLLYWDARTGHMPFWVGFTVYGGFLILGAVDMARRFLFAARGPEARHDVDRAV